MSHLVSRTAIGMALTIACAAALSASPDPARDGLTEARAAFAAGAAGDAKAGERAAEAFATLSASHPGHPVLLAYQGALLALQGRDAFLPWQKMRAADKGAKLIDAARAMLAPAHEQSAFRGTPEGGETRLVAARTLLALPEFMGRQASGKQVLEAALASPGYPASTEAVRGSLLALAAQQARRERRSGDEAGLLRQVVALAPQSAEGRQAALRLKEIGA